MPPSLALAESACLRASARTFLGKPISWLRGVGPKARPPPRKMLTRAEPWRALPVPFWRYIFLPVRLISARFLTAWVPARLEAEDRVRHGDRTGGFSVEGGDLQFHVTRPPGGPASRPVLRRAPPLRT